MNFPGRRLYLLLLPVFFCVGLFALLLNMGDAAQGVEQPDRCFATPNGGTTVYASSGFTPVQAAINALGPSGGTVLMAGTCSGVQERAGISQTVYISSPVTLRGGYTVTEWSVPDPIANPTVLDAETGGRVIYATAALTLENLTLQNGVIEGDREDGCPSSGCGGGLYTNSTLAMSNTHVVSNTASWSGAGLYSEGRRTTFYKSLILSNRSLGFGGGLFVSSTLAMTGTDVLHNTAGEFGGGLHSEGSRATVYNSRFLSNTASDGGGISAFNDSFTVQSSEISGNNANAAFGGAIFSENSTVTVADSTIRRNWAQTLGGGFMVGGGTLMITNTTISENVSEVDGGGIWSGKNDIELNNSTISGNTAGGTFQASGGGINSNDSRLTLNNSTISGNRILTDTTVPGGAGISAFNGALTVNHSTIVSNTALLLGGQDGIAVTGTVAVTLSRSIVAYNGSQNCAIPSGALFDAGYNLEDANDCGFSGTGSLTNMNPLLGPLADNGGDTHTHALLAGSPAIDAIPTGSCELLFDQRGVARPQLNGCDMGAFELTVPVFLPLIMQQP